MVSLNVFWVKKFKIQDLTPIPSVSRLINPEAIQEALTLIISQILIKKEKETCIKVKLFENSKK